MGGFSGPAHRCRAGGRVHRDRRFPGEEAEEEKEEKEAPEDFFALLCFQASWVVWTRGTVVLRPSSTPALALLCWLCWYYALLALFSFRLLSGPGAVRRGRCEPGGLVRGGAVADMPVVYDDGCRVTVCRKLRFFSGCGSFTGSSTPPSGCGGRFPWPRLFFRSLRFPSCAWTSGLMSLYGRSCEFHRCRWCG